MKRRTKFVINPVGRITRVRPSEVAHILKKNPEIRLCTKAEIAAFTRGAAPAAEDEQTSAPTTIEEQIENLCEALKKEDMLNVITEGFDLQAPPANATKDGLAAIILDQENGYETAMAYAQA